MDRIENCLDLNFRPAKEAETGELLALYKAVVGRPFCVWDDEYPNLAVIKQDITEDNLFVLENAGRIIGAVSVVPETETDTAKKLSAGRKAGEFARVVIHPDLQGRRLSCALVSNVLQVMRKRGYEMVYIEVALKNIPAQRLYNGFGFKTVGEAELWGNRYYICELALS